MISYAPFWVTLRSSPETTYTLIKNHHISSSTIDKLRRNKPLNTTTETITGDNTNTQKDVVEDYNSFDCSLALGAQYKITANIGVDARYNIGLTNVFPAVKNDKGEELSEAWGKQGVLQVGVFYEF